MSLIYAARFPGKVRRLVLAGAPVDIRAGDSSVSEFARQTLPVIFAELGRLGGGPVLGQRVLELWGSALDPEESARVLQLASTMDPTERCGLEQRFRNWYGWTVDLPGTYYIEVVSWLFKENRIAKGRFMALGRTIDLATVKIPVFLLAGRDDSLVSTAQLLATARLIGTPEHDIESAVEPCGHLSLFIGKLTLARVWRRVAKWLGRDRARRPRPRMSTERLEHRRRTPRGLTPKGVRPTRPKALWPGLRGRPPQAGALVTRDRRTESAGLVET